VKRYHIFETAGFVAPVSACSALQLAAWRRSGRRAAHSRQRRSGVSGNIIGQLAPAADGCERRQSPGIFFYYLFAFHAAACTISHRHLHRPGIRATWYADYVTAFRRGAHATPSPTATTRSTPTTCCAPMPRGCARGAWMEAATPGGRAGRFKPALRRILQLSSGGVRTRVRRAFPGAPQQIDDTVDMRRGDSNASTRRRCSSEARRALSRVKRRLSALPTEQRHKQ